MIDLLNDLQDLLTAWESRQIAQGCSTFTVHREHANELRSIVERNTPSGPTVIIHKWVKS
jgi:hypothetical protein